MSFMVMTSTRDRYWYLDRHHTQYHRADGPAVELSDGYRAWWVNGELHRTDGPAVEYADGSREWWLNDNLHRTDGPAVERADGTCLWFLNGKEVDQLVVWLKMGEQKNIVDIV